MYTKYSYELGDLCRMPKRFDESHKGDYGRLLLIVGSKGMCGAAYLAAKAAYRTGAGLVHILTAEENLVAIQALIPEAIVSTYNSDSLDLDLVDGCIEKADAICIGCGLGSSDISRRLVSHVLKVSDKPTVVDADALNIASQSEVLKRYLSGKIITPHVGEMSRLTGLTCDDISHTPEQTALDFAGLYRTVCVLKRHKTLVSDGGEKIYENRSGNNGMSTAGAGDVLAGIIGGILAQSKNTETSLTEAASLGVYIHGLAGDDAKTDHPEKNIEAYDEEGRDVLAVLGEERAKHGNSEKSDVAEYHSELGDLALVDILYLQTRDERDE